MTTRKFLGLLFLLAACFDPIRGQIGNLGAAVKDFESNTVSEWSSDISTWEAPYEVQDLFPYYVSGYDYEKRPVVIWELGKWDLKKYVDDKGSEGTALLKKYVEQTWFRINNLTSIFPEAEEGVTLIIDANKFSATQLTSLDVIKIQLTMARYAEKVEPNVARCFCINMSFVAEAWVNLIRPVAGRLAGRMETFGPNASKWRPVLANHIPRDQLPPWYGGNSKPNEYKPVKVWG